MNKPINDNVTRREHRVCQHRKQEVNKRYNETGSNIFMLQGKYWLSNTNSDWFSTVSSIATKVCIAGTSITFARRVEWMFLQREQVL